MKNLKLSLGLLAGLGTLALGCQQTSPTARAPIVTQADSTAQLEAQAQEFGNVELRIVWPQRTQAIPLSANTMVIQAFNTLGREVLATTVHRADAVDAMNIAALRLPTGTYTIEARAYRELSPAVGSVPVAMGSVGNVVITTNLKTSLAMTLTAELPSAGALSATNGAPGSTFTLDTVTYFARPVTATDSVEVWFGSMPSGLSVPQPIVQAAVQILPRRVVDPTTGMAQMVDPETDRLSITVPTTAQGTMYLTLKVDGIRKEISTAFKIVNTLVFGTGVNMVNRAVGETYAAKADLHCFALESEVTMSYPQLTWSSSAPSVAFVSQRGTVYAYKAGSATITARSGNRSATFVLGVTDRHSTASITVEVPQLNVGTVAVPLDVPAYSGDDTGNVSQP